MKKNLFPLFFTILGIVGLMYTMGVFIVYQVSDLVVPNFVFLSVLFFISAITSFVGVSNLK
jgi:hypothetical protein